MIRIHHLAALAAALSSGPPAQGQIPDISTGEGLYSLCTSRDTVQRTYCLGLVVGFASGAETAALEADRPPPFCVPDDATNGQLLDVIVEGLRRAPELRIVPAEVLMMAYFKRAFPCAPPNAN